MKVTPLKTHSAPRFPTRWAADAHPGLLRLVPKRWQSNPAVLTALASLCMIAVAGVKWRERPVILP